jgi:diguanylate cyclase (GGDEF)-like protein
MDTHPNTPVVSGLKPAETLDRLLGQNERVKDLVEGCAEDLTSVNTSLKLELEDHHPGPGIIAKALGQTEAAEEKVHEASEQLADVNQALKEEIEGRGLLEEELTKTIEQGEKDRHASLHDHLTGLPNRALFLDRLEHGLAQAHRHQWNLAVLFLDLDDFKKINDTYGHDIGDAVLKTVADRLREHSRDDDTVSRHGGDEFMYLLMAIRDEHDAALISQKFIDALQAPCPVLAGGQNIILRIKASIGISLFPKNGQTAEELIRKADAAMYEAKRNNSGFKLSE